MTYILVVTYLNILTHTVDVKTYDMPNYQECSRQAQLITSKVKAGKVSTVCWRKL